MHSLFSAMARTFARVFVGQLLVFMLGVLSAPDLGAARGLALAALLASIAAAIRALQAYVPKLTLTHWLAKAGYAKDGVYADAFLHGFVTALIGTLAGLLTAPELGTWRAVATSVLAGAATAGVRGVQGVLTPGEWPAPAVGIPAPPAAAAVGASPAAEQAVVEPVPVPPAKPGK